jgi:YfiH family protein
VRVRRVVTTRAGGVSEAPFDSFNLGADVGDKPAAVAANRKRLAVGIGLAQDQLVWMQQVHGTAVAIVDRPRSEPAKATDALVSAEPGLALAVLTADCVPVLLTDPAAGVVAAVHAGRMGAKDGVARRALDAMRSVGADVGRVEALLGPAVCGKCYEVPAELQADVEARLPGTACRTSAGTPGLDLRAGLWGQLAEAGVARIGVDPRCTFESPELYSYRRDGKTGRIAALIWLEPS